MLNKLDCLLKEIKMQDQLRGIEPLKNPNPACQDEKNKHEALNYFGLNDVDFDNYQFKLNKKDIERYEYITGYCFGLFRQYKHEFLCLGSGDFIIILGRNVFKLSCFDICEDGLGWDLFAVVKSKYTLEEGFLHIGKTYNQYVLNYEPSKIIDDCVAFSRLSPR